MPAGASILSNLTGGPSPLRPLEDIKCLGGEYEEIAALGLFFSLRGREQPRALQFTGMRK
jgi:hypothetical protein